MAVTVTLYLETEAVLSQIYLHTLETLDTLEHLINTESQLLIKLFFHFGHKTVVEPIEEQNNSGPNLHTAQFSS